MVNQTAAPEGATNTPPTKKEELTDEREKGNWKSRYPFCAWCQIVVELIYLLVGLIFSLFVFYQIAVACHVFKESGIGWHIFDGASHHALALSAVATGGACGGFSYALKWLYHGVAHGWWNCDRVIWRLVVPFLSATLALFTALMIGSGIIPIFSVEITNGPRGGAAYGFFVGFFSDDLVGALQRLANHTLGKLGRSGKDD